MKKSLVSLKVAIVSLIALFFPQKFIKDPADNPAEEDIPSNHVQ